MSQAEDLTYYSEKIQMKQKSNICYVSMPIRAINAILWL